MYCPLLEACTAKDQLPQWKLIRIIYDVSHQITKNVIFRTFIYLLVVVLLVLCSLVHLVSFLVVGTMKRHLNCGFLVLNYTSTHKINVSGWMFREVFKNQWNFIKHCHRKRWWTFFDLLEFLGRQNCNLLKNRFVTNSKNFQSVTHSLVLVICTSFLFLRIHFLLKFGISLLVNVFYFYIVFIWVNDIYDASPTTNPALDSKIAHFLKVSVTTVIFHMIDRQTEYIQRVDFK